MNVYRITAALIESTLLWGGGTIDPGFIFAFQNTELSKQRFIVYGLWGGG